MEIDRNNYETHFLDYFENRLSSEDAKDLMTFLSLNPDLLIEFNEFENITLEPANSVYNEKFKLKKTLSDIKVINETNLDEFCISKIEGDIDDAADIKLLTYFEENPTKKAIYELYLKLKLKPDYSIRFDGKSKLKRKYIGKSSLRTIYLIAAAAAILLAIVSYTLLYNPEIPVNQNLLTNNPISALPNIDESKIPEKHLQADQNKANVMVIKKVEETVLPEIHLNKFSLQEIASKNAIIQCQNNIFYEPKLVTGDNDILTLSEIAKTDTGKGNRKIDGDHLSLQDLAINKIVDLAQKGNIVNSDSKNVSFKEMLKQGLSKLNEISGINLAFDKEIDTTSNRTVLAFDSNLLGFYSSQRIK
jgi:hypothetical protein